VVHRRSLIPIKAYSIRRRRFPLHYGNENITDAASPDGGTGDVSKASPLGPVTVSVDGEIKETYAYGALFGDLLITGVSDLPDAGFTSVKAAGPVGGFRMPWALRQSWAPISRFPVR
jgi:hypothetical protein